MKERRKDDCPWSQFWEVKVGRALTWHYSTNLALSEDNASTSCGVAGRVAFLVIFLF